MENSVRDYAKMNSIRVEKQNPYVLLGRAGSVTIRVTDKKILAVFFFFTVSV